MKWHRFSFVRDNKTIVRAYAGYQKENGRSMWYVDTDRLSKKDADYFINEFRSYLKAHVGLREIRFKRDSRTVTIPYEFVKNVYSPNNSVVLNWNRGKVVTAKFDPPTV